MSRRRHATDTSDDEEEGRIEYKRRRTKHEVENIEDRLESLITRVGEKSTSSLESNLEGLAAVLQSDLETYRMKILQILCECVVQMPEKLTVYSTLVALLNAKSYAAGGEFVDLLTRKLKEFLKENEFENARTCVRFLADLVNCHVVTVNSLFLMFDTFVDVCLEENTPQVRADWYIYAVVSSLPWVGRELIDKKGPEFERMLDTIEGYICKRQRFHVPALRVWNTDNPHPQEEYLDCLWAQIHLMRRNDWSEGHIIRPYAAFDAMLSDSLQHPIPPLMPPAHDDDCVYPLPFVIFRMFDNLDVPEGPGLPEAHAIERNMLETDINSIIDINSKDKKEPAGVLPGAHDVGRHVLEQQCNQIINVCSLDRKICARQLLSFDLKKKIPLNYIIVECVFGQLFALPAPKHLEIFYGSLLIELCKLQPGSMPQVLAQATEMLYERLDTMNTACIDRFVNWFSYHLSNFQFRWSWEDWADCVKGDPLAPKAKFVQECLLKCMRLSYHQRIVEIVEKCPDEFGVLIPAEPKPFYRFNTEDADSLPGAMTAGNLIQAIKSKCSPGEAVELMRSCPNPIANSMDMDFNPLKVEVFTQSLLYLGAKSFSHSFAAVAKFHQVLKALADTEEAQIVMLKAIHELWHTHQQMMVVLVDKLLKTQIVECSAVANWIFSSDMAEDFTSFYVWEIMHSTIKKMNKHVSKLQRDVEEAKDKCDAYRRRARDRSDTFMDDDVLTEEQIERLEERLEAAQSEQKNLFLIIFQRFIIILSNHLARCEVEGLDYNTAWYKWVIERLQQVFVLHHEQVYRYIGTLESLMFTSDIDGHILHIFQQFSALKA